MSVELKKQVEAQSERGIEAESEAQVYLSLSKIKSSIQLLMTQIMKN